MPDIDKSVAVIRNIAPVPTLLEVVCRTTGMGFAAVARVTQDRWVTCGVRDEIGFGLTPGGELMVETTICSEIRESKQTVVIDNVMDDPVYCRHQTPVTLRLSKLHFDADHSCEWRILRHTLRPRS